MQAKRKIKICYILSMIVLIANLFMFGMDYQEDVSMIWKIFDVIYLLCSVGAFIGFLIFNFKPINFAIKYKKWFVVLVCVSCVGSLILGYIALIALFEINMIKQKLQIKTIETTGEVLPTYDEIVKKIKELDELKQQKLITEDEYAERKQQVLDSLVKK